MSATADSRARGHGEAEGDEGLGPGHEALGQAESRSALEFGAQTGQQQEFCVNGETATVPAGSIAFVPQGATHAFHNRSSEPARMLVITTPQAIDLIMRMPEGSKSPQARRALFAEHDSQIDGPPLG